MSLTRQEVIKHIERAEELYKANIFTHLDPHLTAVQENFEVLGDHNLADNARYYRIFMLYISAFEELNITVMQSYLNALENINEVQASDYEYICSFYKQCDEAVYQKALMAHPYNETLHIHYALKLQEDKRFAETITVLKYILECYPTITEARILLWEIQATQLENLCKSAEASDCYELLDLASSTHNLEVLKGLQLDERLEKKSKSLTYIQVALWENKSVEVWQQWKAEWKHLELTATTRYVLADYAKAFMMYDMVSQILKAAPKTAFPEEEFINFETYKSYMHALAHSGWQLAQHHYLLMGNVAYYHTKNKNTLNNSIEQGLAQNPKNPLLLALKAKSFFAEQKYNETAVAYHEAFKNGLTMSEYLLYLLEVNSRVQSWQGILDIVEDYHRRKLPTLKTLFFKARALVMLQQFNEALTVLNKALADFPLPAHSYAPWLYNLRMVIHRKNHNYTAFLEDMQLEINYYTIGDANYCSTMNMCVEAIFEMGDYEECYKFAFYNHEQGQLTPELYPIFQWLCFYDFLVEKPDDLKDLTEADVVPEPITFTDYRNNGLIYWILENHNAATEALEHAAALATNKAYYLKLALTCSKEGFNNSKSLTLCETIKREVPEARDWKTDYEYANLLEQENRPKDTLLAFQTLVYNFPEQSFFEFPKNDTNVLARTLKTCAKKLNHTNEYTKYNALLLGKDIPPENAVKEHLEISGFHGKEDLFLRHNLLGSLLRLDIEMNREEQEELKLIKSTLITTHFS